MQTYIRFRLVLRKDFVLQGFTKALLIEILGVKNAYMIHISVVQCHHACQRLYTEKPSTKLIRDICAQNLMGLLILYNDWQGLYYQMNDSILSLLKE